MKPGQVWEWIADMISRNRLTGGSGSRPQANGYTIDGVSYPLEGQPPTAQGGNWGPPPRRWR
ncbi:hypothetical protein ACGFI9_31890 [Micromonospora sp. NPDC048930]|uniref:hypothetical protein n=1 Tax=Micromonospora sp. NPDC048930 TaxID=3364261 RepID=UPI0037104A32